MRAGQAALVAALAVLWLCGSAVAYSHGRTACHAPAEPSCAAVTGPREQATANIETVSKHPGAGLPFSALDGQLLLIGSCTLLVAGVAIRHCLRPRASQGEDQAVTRAREHGGGYA